MAHLVLDKAALRAGDALLPGDFIVTHDDGPIDRLIQLATRSHWNHSALIVSPDGDLVELVGQGIRRSHISKYDKKNLYLVRLDSLSDEDRRQIVHYADVMVERHQRYGYLTIATIVVKILTRSRLVIKLDGTLICSEFVGKALAHGGQVWEQDTSLITPADLYNRYVLPNLADGGAPMGG